MKIKKLMYKAMLASLMMLQSFSTSYAASRELGSISYSNAQTIRAAGTTFYLNNQNYVYSYVPWDPIYYKDNEILSGLKILQSAMGSEPNAAGAAGIYSGNKNLKMGSWFTRWDPGDYPEIRLGTAKGKWDRGNIRLNSYSY